MPKEKTQTSTMKRKIIGNVNTGSVVGLPSYVINGTAYCDKCLLAELVHGYHRAQNNDLCFMCFDSLIHGIEKDGWIEFSI
jgi:hypothetical protein